MQRLYETAQALLEAVGSLDTTCVEVLGRQLNEAEHRAARTLLEQLEKEGL